MLSIYLNEQFISLRDVCQLYHVIMTAPEHELKLKVIQKSVLNLSPYDFPWGDQSTTTYISSIRPVYYIAWYKESSGKKKKENPLVRESKQAREKTVFQTLCFLPFSVHIFPRLVIINSFQ